MSDGEMWQRFSNSATRVIHFAQKEAKRAKTHIVGTEHLLLGLVREGEGVAARVLERLDVTLGRIRAEVERQDVGTEEPALESPRLLLSVSAKKVLEDAIEVAREINSQLGLLDYVDTEHLLLGLLREGSGAGSKAIRVLEGLGVEPERVRTDVMTLLSGSAMLVTPAPPASCEPMIDCYEELTAYQDSLAAAKRIFTLSKRFPAMEHDSLTRDLRRSSRYLCFCVAQVWQQRADARLAQDTFATARLHVIEIRTLLDCAIGCGYLDIPAGDELKTLYSELLAELGQYC